MQGFQVDRQRAMCKPGCSAASLVGFDPWKEVRWLRELCTFLCLLCLVCLGWRIDELRPTTTFQRFATTLLC